MKSELYKQIYIELFRINDLLQNDITKRIQYKMDNTHINGYNMKDCHIKLYDNGMILYTHITDKNYECSFCVYESDNECDDGISARCTVSDDYMWIQSILNSQYTPYMCNEYDRNIQLELYNDSIEIESQRFQTELIVDKPEYLEYLDLEYALRGHIPNNMYISFNLTVSPNIPNEILESCIIELKKVI